jgi:RNA polymerase sigma-70 factor (ECF subfamily)
MAWESIQTSVAVLRDFERFVNVYRPGILSLCRQRGLGDEAEDVCQEVLLKLHQKLPTFEYDPRKPFRGWLATVVRHAISDYLAKRARQLDRARGGSEALKWLQEVRDSGADASVLIPDGDIKRLLENVLFVEASRRVQADLRAPTSWRAMFGIKLELRPPEEVAKELGMSRPAAMMAARRAFLRLLEEMQGLKTSGL